jgi:hypothetical protein
LTVARIQCGVPIAGRPPGESLPALRRWYNYLTRDTTMATHPYQQPAIQTAILSEGSRERVIEWLVWNDRNGTYTDTDSEAEGLPALTLEAARQVMAEILSRG